MHHASLRAKWSNPATKLICLHIMDCHGSLHSPRNDRLSVIANEVKQSSFSHSSLRAKRNNLATKPIWLPVDCHGSLHSPHNDRLPVIASEAKQSSYYCLLDRHGRLTPSQWQVNRSFHSFAKTANCSFILYDQFAHKVPLNCHYYQTECPLASGRRGYSLY